MQKKVRGETMVRDLNASVQYYAGYPSCRRKDVRDAENKDMGPDTRALEDHSIQ